jgi:hypothetical protein
LARSLGNQAFVQALLDAVKVSRHPDFPIRQGDHAGRVFLFEILNNQEEADEAGRTGGGGGRGRPWNWRGQGILG